MKKQIGLLVLLWVLGCTLFFSCGALSAASPQTNTSSDVLSGCYVPAPSLVADFGALGALCRYSPVSGWSQLAEGSPNLMVRFDSLLVANFPGFGLYEHDGTAWTHITYNDSVENLIAAGSNFCYSFGAAIYADYGSLGIWQYEPYSGNWNRITVKNPDGMWAYDRVLFANFPGDGLYTYGGVSPQNRSWKRVTPNSGVENVVGGYGGAYADFGSPGLWKYDGEWHNLSYSDPNMMLPVYGIWSYSLVANFPGYGLYAYDYNENTWAQLTPDDTVQALVAVGNAFYADYGTGGLWKYGSAGWEQITIADANFLGSYGDNLVANFPGDGGLYQYSRIDSSWAPLTGNGGVTKMVSVNLP